MNEFELSNKIDKSKIFLIFLSELDGRFDPNYYKLKNQTIKRFKYPLEKLGHSFLVKDGDHDRLPPEVIARDGKGKRYLRSQDLKDNEIISEKPIFVSDNYFESVKRCHIFPGDLLFSIMASIGATAVVPSNFPVCTANRAVGILRPRSSGKLLPEFVQALLNTELGISLLELQKRGGIQQRLNLSDIRELKLPLPDQITQQHIIHIYEAGRISKQKKEQEAKKILDSIDDYLLNELGITLPKKDGGLNNRIFTTWYSRVTSNRLDPNYISKIDYLLNQKWKFEIKNLKDLLIKPPQYGANEEAIDGNPRTDTRYIRITDIDEYGNLKETGWKTANKVEDKYLLNLNDILFARSGSVGRCYIHRDISKPSIFAGYLIRFVVNPEKVNPNYLFYFCNSAIYKYWVSAIERPAVQSNINSEEYKSLKIPLPNLDKQNEIAKHISFLRDKAKLQQSEAKSELEKARKEIEKIILG